MAFEETRRGADRRTCARSASTSTSWSQQKKIAGRLRRASSAARSRRPASTTSKACSSASGYAIDSIGAKRVVLDTIEALFGGLDQPGDPARRAAPPVPLAQGQGRHRRHHRRARRRHADPPGPRGVRLRLRDPARPPRHRPGLDAPAAHRQVPRHRARHQRVPVPDRRARASRCCRSRRCGSTTRRPTSGSRPASRASTTMLGGEGFYRGSSVLVSRHGRHRQDQPGRPLRRRALRAAASAASTSRSRNRRARSCATCARSASTSRRWIKKGLLHIVRRAAHAARASRCTWR